MTGRAPDHGTRACYLRGCRQPECLAAHVGYGARRRRQIAYGQWDPFTGAEPVRRHLRALEAAGIKPAQAARIAGVRSNCVAALLHGTGGRPPSRQMRRSSAERLLAVSPRGLDDRTLLDATGTHRRLQALMACGWSTAPLAAALGLPRASQVTGYLARSRVQVSTARAVSDLYDRLWDAAPPSGTYQARAASERIRRLALANEWPLPQAWDDDMIDDPAATPAEGCWHRPKRLSGREIAEEAAELFRQGLDRPLAAERLGIKHSTLNTVLARVQRLERDNHDSNDEGITDAA